MNCRSSVNATVKRHGRQKPESCLTQLPQKELTNDVPRFITHVQTCTVLKQVVASFVNTDFWLDQITQKSRYTRGLRHTLEQSLPWRWAGKTRNWLQKVELLPTSSNFRNQ